ncbi:hypothetical protein Pmani_027479 [Petrolisthes manimaculis]|uniref:C2H2-type domain-containing protein n=1 Tax=Petrolisthes manimaculis TaxID=1843537 RepID=A0AAE1TVQ4_9EUCA|nr:hypothetical protein Pmani_027479 [Petrolisthes manimaculis]
MIFMWKGRIRVKSRRELGLLVTTPTITTTSTTIPTSVSAASPLSPPPTSSPLTLSGNTAVLLSPSVTQPSPLRTSPLPPHLPVSPIPPASPAACSPTTSPLVLSYPLKCPYCGYVGTSESVLLRHLRTHGGGSLVGVQLYHCSSCPYSATQWESVRRHSWRQHRTEIEPEKESRG